MYKHRLIIVDGNELTRALLRHVFQASSTIEIVGEAADYASCIAGLGNVIPDALIIGDEMPKQKRLHYYPLFARTIRVCE